MAPGIIIKAVICNEVDNVYNEHIKVNELSIFQNSPDNHVPWEGLEVTPFTTVMRDEVGGTKTSILAVHWWLSERN